jgi:nitrate/nitrite transporter NarK
MLAIPLSIVVGGPISGLILRMDHVAGLEGWQWLFILEGLPTLILARIVFSTISDRPDTAPWLTDPEKRWLRDTLHSEALSKKGPAQSFRLRTIFTRPVLLLCGVQAACPAVAYGVSFWLPQVVREFGLSITQTGFICAVPFAVGASVMGWWSSHSDKTGERRWHLTLCPLITAVGLGLSLTVQSPLAKLAFLMLASLGMFSFLPLAWAASHRLFSGSAAPTGYAVISMSGAIGGFTSPYVMGLLRERAGNFEAGILLLTAVGIAASLCAFLLYSDQETVPPFSHADARPGQGAG